MRGVYFRSVWRDVTTHKALGPFQDEGGLGVSFPESSSENNSLYLDVDRLEIHNRRVCCFRSDGTGIRSLP